MTRSAHLVPLSLLSLVLLPAPAIGADPLSQDGASTLGELATSDDSFGYALASGDFNQDGFLDLAIGDPHSDLNVSNRGVVYVISGSSTGLGSPQSFRQGDGDVSGTGEANDLFGAALTVGDFNGDTYDDLAVGVPGKSVSGQAGAGQVMIFFGSAPGLRTDNELTLSQDTGGIIGVAGEGDNFGTALAAADFDNDGYDDLAIGIPGESGSGFFRAGLVLVVRGEPGGISSTGEFHWEQGFGGLSDTPGTSEHLGQDLVAGDFDNDGYADLVISVPGQAVDRQPNAGDIQPNAGALHILEGSSTGLSTTGDSYWHQGDGDGGVQGAAVSGSSWSRTLAACDFNGDGRDDLALAMLEATGSGTVQTFQGTASGLDSTSVSWEQGFNVPGTSTAGDQFGESLACGDFDFDGFADLAIGSAYDDDLSSGTVGDGGRVDILYGSPSGPNAADTQSWDRGFVEIGASPVADDHWGTALAVGDFDNNGHDDLAISMVPSFNDGAVDVLFGGLVGSLDSDGDGLTNGVEVHVHLTDPLDIDSDDDGALDGEEIIAGSDPLDANSTPPYAAYQYTGNPFTTATAPVTTANSISGTVTFLTPLPANLASVDFDATDLVKEIDWTDGVDTLKGSIGSFSAIAVSTDGAGNIVEWGVFFVDENDISRAMGTCSGPVNHAQCLEYASLGSVLEGGVGDLTSEFESYVVDDPGTWISVPAPPPDTDLDGLSDADEVILGTDPHNADSDGDGLTDGDEVNLSATDPLDSDSDGDGLADGDEVNVHLTDPLDIDSDNDGTLDIKEILAGSDPVDVNSIPAYTVYQYTGNLFTAAVPPVTTSDSVSGSITLLQPLLPNLIDSYAGSLIDEAEWTDGDRTFSYSSTPGLLVDFRVSTDVGGNIVLWGAIFSLETTDAIGTCNAPSASTGILSCNPDNFPLSVLGAVADSTQRDPDPFSASVVYDDPGTWTVVPYVSPDLDGDGLTNEEEVVLGTDPHNADSDGDGLSDGNEVSPVGTDPVDADSDDDGFSDGGEHLALSDPNDGTSLPFFGLPAALNSDASIDSADNSWPDLATDGMGNWVATWEEFDGASWDIAVSRSNDDGASWSPKEIFLDGLNLGTEGGSDYRRPHIAIDPSGTCIVTYQAIELVLGSEFYRVRAQDSTDLCATPYGSGAAWETEPGDFLEKLLPEQSPSIATDGSGNFVIVWAEPEFGILDWEIWTARSLDGGMSWTAKANLSANTGLDASVEIATDASGTWIAAWTSDDDLGGSIGPDHDILFSTSIDNGATWSIGAALNGNADTDSGGDTDPHLTSDGAGNWIVVWESGEDLGGSIGTDFDILASTSIDGGASWSLTPTVVNSEAIVDGSWSDFSPHIGTDAAGNWYAIWSSNNPMALGPENQDYDLLVSRSTDNGTSWSAQALANLNGASDLVPARSPRLITDRNGHWVLGWEGPGEVTTETDDDIFFATAFGPDSDGDGLADGEEVNSLGTDPLDADSDEDGLTDGEELGTYLTDPLDPDSDDDGFPDGAEVSAGSDPLDSGSTPAPAVPGLSFIGAMFLTGLFIVIGVREMRITANSDPRR